MTGIVIVSGFLGAGKTTFIKKILEKVSAGKKLAIIENEFGDVGIDGEILSKYGMNIREINSGCICCSVAGDFKTSILELKKDYDPETIIIEPSGVAKLSDIEEICISRPELFYIKKKIVVVDLNLYEIYTINFGDFYNDQIKNADIIVFSRYTEAINSGIDIEKVKKDILEKNNKALILDKEWNEIEVEYV